MNNLPPGSPPALTARSRRLSPVAEGVVAGVLLLAALALVVLFFERLPIENTSLAIDWKGLWQGIQGGRLRFGNETGLRVTPWVAVLLLPLGWLSFRASWGVLSLLTLAVLVASVPRATSKWRRWLGILLLVTAYPALAQLADGNLELLTIAGVLLCVHGYAQRQPVLLAGGLLLATAKVQETWVLLLVLGVYVLRAWPPGRWLQTGGLAALVAVPSLLWLGPAWFSAVVGIEQRGSIMDISLGAALTRLGAPAWVLLAGWGLVAAVTAILAWRSGTELSREKAGLLITASLLLAPYAAGNNYLAVLAVGVIPLIVAGQPAGFVLLALSNLPYFTPAELELRFSAYYSTTLLLLTWGVFLARLWPSQRLAPVNAGST